VPSLILLAILLLPVAVQPPPARASSRSYAAAVSRSSGWPAYGWPVRPPFVVRRFDPPPRPWLAGHRGVDLSGAPSAVVRAAGAGTVVYAGGIAGRGVVSVAHPGGLRTTYEPVTSTLHAGDAVRAGAVLGRLDTGHPGCPAAACLHWGLRQGDRYLDPLALLGLGRVRLLPLAPSTPAVSAGGR
jgi:murein DD-endopeptidase MepM/ murein hydrolase activator NlpD